MEFRVSARRQSIQKTDFNFSYIYKSVGNFFVYFISCVNLSGMLNVKSNVIIIEDISIIIFIDVF